MDQYSRIGAYVKTLRESKKMSQEETAQQLNLSTRTLQRYESGEINALDKLISLADYYEVSLSELVTGGKNYEDIANGDKEKLLASFADEVAKKNLFRIYGLGFALTLILSAMVIFAQYICKGSYSPEVLLIVIGPSAVMAFIFYKQENSGLRLLMRMIRNTLWCVNCRNHSH